MKFWGLRLNSWGLQLESGVYYEILGVLNENRWVFIEILGVCNENLGSQ